jgi:hypothetical protein
MKKFFSVVVAAMLLFAPYADAKTCTAISCNYIDTNAGFASGFTDWTTGGATIANPGNCYSSAMAELSPGDTLERPAFYVDNSYASYKLVFRAWLVNDNNNYYDELKVRVTNTDTGAYEEMSMNGLSYTNQCGYIVFNLNNDYDLSHVTVKFYTGNFTIRNWQLDDVGFFATI